MRSSAITACVFGILAVPAFAAAQQPRSVEQQIQTAVAPLPEKLRDGARVLGYRPGAAGLVELRAGSNRMTCLADDPSDETVHTACYHDSLEPFMGRGRALRAAGHAAAAVDSIRNAELEAKKITIPAGASVYNLRAKTLDAATGEPVTPQRWYVVYTPYATGESIGYLGEFVPGAPWIMFPGTARSHLMIVPPAPEPKPGS